MKQCLLGPQDVDPLLNTVLSLQPRRKPTGYSNSPYEAGTHVPGEKISLTILQVIYFNTKLMSILADYSRLRKRVVSENAGLDVGCGGTRHTGFVGLDISRTAGADILADAHFLPFVDEAFVVTYSSHVLEHVKHPYIVLTELRRVSRRGIVVRVPMSNPYSDPKEHLYSWTPATLYNFLACEFQDVKMSYHLYNEEGLNPIKRKAKIFQQILLGFFLRREIGELLAICRKPKKS